VRIVICDTGPILHLREAEAPELLAAAGDILIPPAGSSPDGQVIVYAVERAGGG